MHGHMNVKCIYWSLTHFTNLPPFSGRVTSKLVPTYGQHLMLIWHKNISELRQAPQQFTNLLIKVSIRNSQTAGQEKLTIMRQPLNHDVTSLETISVRHHQQFKSIRFKYVHTLYIYIYIYIHTHTHTHTHTHLHRVNICLTENPLLANSKKKSFDPAQGDNRFQV